MAGNSPHVPASEWLTYSAAAERLGLPQNVIALRAGRWPTRKRSDTGEVEIEVPGTVLALTVVEGAAGTDPELRSRVAEAVSRAHMPRTSAEDRPLARLAAALRQTWRRLRR